MHDDFKNDVSSGYAYLDGSIEYDRRGVPRTRFYPEGSKESDECRRGLARVLRSENPLPRQLREMLADMFEPQASELSVWRERKLTASNRAKKRPRDHVANTHMSWFVWERVNDGAGVEAAISDAVDKFQVSREQMYKLWSAFRPQFETIVGRLPKKKRRTQ